jgi:hypothetical protein
VRGFESHRRQFTFGKRRKNSESEDVAWHGTSAAPFAALESAMEVRITSAGMYILFPRLTCIGDGDCATCRHVARALDAPVLHGGPLRVLASRRKGLCPHLQLAARITRIMPHSRRQSPTPRNGAHGILVRTHISEGDGASAAGLVRRDDAGRELCGGSAVGGAGPSTGPRPEARAPARPQARAPAHYLATVTAGGEWRCGAW